MTTLSERIPVDDITAQAKQVKFSRSLLTLIAAILFAIGWLVAKFFTVAWFACVWCAVATREGWREGRGKQDKASPVL